MTHTTSDQREQPGTAPSLIAALSMVCLLAAALPASMPTPASGVSQEECLTLGDRPVAGGAELALLEECSALYPDDVELLEHLGAAYETTDSDRAIRVYTRALELDASFAELRLRLGRLLLRQGDAAGALHHVEAALRVQPNRKVLLDLRSEARAVAGERP
jgi:tetratricopeptide (TPR) repeat protein